jgi:hypothetical protein
VPRDLLTHDQYITRRVQGQISFFEKNAAAYQRTANSLKWIEFVLTLAATLITAIASVTGKSVPIFGHSFDIAAFTAVLTTIAGAVLAHIEASRFDYLVASYLATKRRLEDRLAAGQEPWTDFVNACEDILATENASWIVKWTK